MAKRCTRPATPSTSRTATSRAPSPARSTSSSAPRRSSMPSRPTCRRTWRRCRVHNAVRLNADTNRSLSGAGDRSGRTMIEASREHLGWVLRESGPEGADHTVLLLPGALCTAAFYDDLLAEPSMSKTPIRFVATTIPGFGGTAPPKDMSMESYAKLAGELASDLGCDAVVGHSLGANIALEMAAAGEFSVPLVLLSPSFSRRDESRFPRALDRLSRVLGQLPYSLMLKIIGPAMKSGLPPTRREALIAELKKNDPHFLRQQTHHYLQYLDRHGSL